MSSASFILPWQPVVVHCVAFGQLAFSVYKLYVFPPVIGLIRFITSARCNDIWCLCIAFLISSGISWSVRHNGVYNIPNNGCLQNLEQNQLHLWYFMLSCASLLIVLGQVLLWTGGATCMHFMH